MHKFSPRRIFRGRGKTWMVPAAMLVIVLAVIAGALVMHSVSQRHLQLDNGASLGDLAGRPEGGPLQRAAA